MLVVVTVMRRVAVCAVHVVQVAVVLEGGVHAIGTVLVVVGTVNGVDRHGMLVDMPFVGVMDVAVMEVVDVPAVLEGRVAAFGAVEMGVGLVDLMGGGAHGASFRVVVGRA